MPEGIDNNHGSNPEHNKRARDMFANFMNRNFGHQKKNNEYEFPDDTTELTADDYKAIHQEHDQASLKTFKDATLYEEVKPLARTRKDIRDSVELLGTPITGDQLIQHIDKSKEQTREQ